MCHMNINPEKLLKAFTVVQSDDAESFHAYIAGMEGHHQRKVAKSGKAPFELRHARLCRMEIGLGCYGATVEVEKTRKSSDAYLIQFPLTAPFSVTLNGQTYRVIADQGVIISPAHHVHRTGVPGWILLLKVPCDQIRISMEKRVGQLTSGPIVFEPMIDAFATELLQYGLLVVDAIDRGIAKNGNAVAQVLEAGFIELLLSHQPHNYSHVLHEETSSPRSNRMHMVQQYVESHLAEPLTVEQLARVAGCSVRSLQSSFLDLCKMSPMEFVRMHRLARARQMLESSEPDNTVNTVALRTGHAQLSRFAASYKQRFGESPSETLRRTRKRNNSTTRK